jgi:3',5'-cyclic AMP phosphodiesterase CpdA
MSVTIMHISDVHLGDDLIPRSLLRLHAWWKYVDKDVTNGLTRAIRKLEPDFIVLSGDIVNKPTEATFRVAVKYLRDLFQNAGFDIKERLLVIPGNHDVGFFPKKNPDDLLRLRLYREFLRELFQENDIEARRQRFKYVDSKGKVIFFCLDSTLKNFAPLAEGEIGVSQREWLKDKIAQLKKELGDTYSSYVKIAVFHHHCVPIAGTSPSGERFMQLLDAGDFLKTLDDENFQVAMHGHKHYPHTQLRNRSDSSVLTVIGAGTTTCAYVEEQAGQGNNFNLITLSPEDGVLIYQLYKADQNGEFAPQGESKRFPLFRVNPQGYKVGSIRSISTLSPDGTLTEQLIKENLRVLEPPTKIRTLPFRLAAGAGTAKITNFRQDTDDATLKVTIQQDALHEGEWILKQEMMPGSPPITIAYSYSLQAGTAMDQKQYQQMYHSDGKEESSSVIVTNPADTLNMEVTFPTVPKRFPAVPSVRVEHLGTVIPVESFQCTFTYHKGPNRCELEMQNPPLDHQISIVWPLPESWDIGQPPVSENKG